MIKDYLSIVKPGIICGNAITVAAGFFLASRGSVNWWLFLVVLLGVSLVMASGCVFNNYIDRDIDAMMERTRDRALVRGVVPPHAAVVYAASLGILGTTILLFTNILTAVVALLGLFVYVVVYTFWLKRHSGYGVLAGSISGAVPPLAGYLAVSGRIDVVAIVLFLVLVLWQIPHSFAFALYRLEDCVKAGIVVLPLKRGIKMHMFVYVALFIAATFLLAVVANLGPIYWGVMLFIGGLWLLLAFLGLGIQDDKRWARRMFFFSIIVIVIFSIMVVTSSLLRLSI